MTRAAQIFEMAELQELFNYPNRRALTHAIRVNKFPIQTFDMGGRKVASVAVVKKYFELKAQEGLDALSKLDDWDI